jgi:Brp/Blh family beta-carotene 15,15'-monooxygenase
MLRILLLLLGCGLLITQQFFFSLSTQVQFILFAIGILLLGVPHGAADLLVATHNADQSKRAFSKIRFFGIYLGRLLLFALTLWFFPGIGNFLFIFFAAYHFGETDLYQFNTKTVIGKLFVISYGLVILSVILIHHFQDIIPIYTQFETGKEYLSLLNWIDGHRFAIISASGILFFTTTFIYFLTHQSSQHYDSGYFLIRFAVLLILLFQLPMLLGFTFYFVVWHSSISLQNIVAYLQSKRNLTAIGIIKQIAFYSCLAIVGIVLFGLTGFMFVNSNAIMGYLFLGLAVLTAPHMQIMHDMYCMIRTNRSK